MDLTIPLRGGLGLVISEGPSIGTAYATRQLQHGFRLMDHGLDLSEEAVGFGVPVAKRGLHTIFPGKVALASEQTGSLWHIDALFTLNMEERITRGSSPSIRGWPIYAAKDLLAALLRRSRALRGTLTSVSSWLRSRFDLRTVYDDTGFRATLAVHYLIDSTTGVIRVSLNPSDLAGRGVTEVILMNEQGGRWFDIYRDSAGGNVAGMGIGAWDRVTAEEASMVSSARKVVFTVAGGDGAKLYRGREVEGSRLAWSGFGYSMDPALGSLEYDIRVARVP